MIACSARLQVGVDLANARIDLFVLLGIARVILRSNDEERRSGTVRTASLAELLTRADVGVSDFLRFAKGGQMRDNVHGSNIGGEENNTLGT